MDIGRQKQRLAHKPRLINASFIRTMTVGSGIKPDLLTSPPEERSWAIPPVGTSTPPRRLSW